MIPKGYITVAEAKKLSGRSRQAIYAAIADGRLKSRSIPMPFVRGGSVIVVAMADILRGVWREKNHSNHTDLS